MLSVVLGGVVAVAVNAGNVSLEEPFRVARGHVLEVVAVTEHRHTARAIVEPVAVIDSAPDVQEWSPLRAAGERLVQSKPIAPLSHHGAGRDNITAGRLFLAHREALTEAKQVCIPFDDPTNLSRREVSVIADADMRNRALVADFFANADDPLRLNADISSLEGTSVRNLPVASRLGFPPQENGRGPQNAGEESQNASVERHRIVRGPVPEAA